MEFRIPFQGFRMAPIADGAQALTKKFLHAGQHYYLGWCLWLVPDAAMGESCRYRTMNGALN